MYVWVPFHPQEPREQGSSCRPPISLRKAPNKLSLGDAGWESTLSVTHYPLWPPRRDIALSSAPEDAQPSQSLGTLAFHKTPRGQAGKHPSAFQPSSTWVRGRGSARAMGTWARFGLGLSASFLYLPPSGTVPSKSWKSGLFRGPLPGVSLPGTLGPDGEWEWGASPDSVGPGQPKPGAGPAFW